MAYKVYVVYLLLISATSCNGMCWCWGAAITGVACAVAAPIVIPAALGALGFGAGGIVAGSVAAGAMATSAPVAVGSAVAIGQSIGAAGIGLGGKAIAAIVGYAGYSAIFGCD